MVDVAVIEPDGGEADRLRHGRAWPPAWLRCRCLVCSPELGRPQCRPWRTESPIELCALSPYAAGCLPRIGPRWPAEMHQGGNDRCGRLYAIWRWGSVSSDARRWAALMPRSSCTSCATATATNARSAARSWTASRRRTPTSRSPSTPCPTRRSSRACRSSSPAGTGPDIARVTDLGGLHKYYLDLAPYVDTPTGRRTSATRWTGSAPGPTTRASTA